MKIGILSAFARGWYAAFGLRGLVLLKWSVNLACGFFAILPVWFLFADQWDRSLVNESSFSTISIDQIVELIVKNWDKISLYAWVILPILAFFVIANVFMSAGIMRAVNYGKPASWPDFFHSCSSYFFSMVRLALLCLVLLALFVLLPQALLGKLVESIRERATGPMPALIAGWVKTFVVIILLSGVLRIYDYSRLLACIDKKAWRAFKQGILFTRRNHFRTFGLWFLFVTVSLGSGLVYAKLDPIQVTNNLSLLLSFLLGQILLLFKTMTSVASLAGQQRFMAHRLETASSEPSNSQTITEPAAVEAYSEPVLSSPQLDQETQFLPRTDDKSGRLDED